jgi:hypothetical protein
MKIHLIVYGCLTVILSSCDFSQSVNKDLVSGMVTRGKGLSCQDVELLAGNEKARESTFRYGEMVRIEFKGMEGFERINGNAYPGMSLTVTENKTDTVLHYQDLYQDLVDGTSNSPLMLVADLVLANPLHSGRDYTLQVRIRDKKGNATFSSRLGFKVVPDDGIVITADRMSWEEIYLYSASKNRVLTDKYAGYNETIYLIIEGLDGMTVSQGAVQLGLSLTISDSTGNRILAEKDLLGGNPLDAGEVKERLATHFFIRDTGVASPVNCDFRIWDKNSGKNIQASCQLHIE